MVILRELKAITRSAQRVDDRWYMVSCLDEKTASKISNSLSELGYEVYTEKGTEGQNVRFRRPVKVEQKC